MFHGLRVNPLLQEDWRIVGDQFLRRGLRRPPAPVGVRCRRRKNDGVAADRLKGFSTAFASSIFHFDRRLLSI